MNRIARLAIYPEIVMILLLCVSSSAKGQENLLVTYPAPEGAVRSYDFIVRVNGEPVDLYGAPTRYGNLASFGYFDFTGSVEVEIVAPFGPQHSTSFSFLPEHLGIEPKEHNNRRVVFDINRPMNLTVVVTGDYTGNVLHLFANGPESWRPDPSDPDVIYFGPGFHEAGEGKTSVIRPQENQTVYIAGGAYVKGSIRIENTRNVRVLGRGVLAQSGEMSNDIGIHIIRSEDILVEGITLTRHRHHWCGLIINSRGVEIRDFKVVSPPIWSSDGMNAINSRDIVYDNCFMRTGDDCIAIKGFGSTGGRQINDNPKNGAPNENITIKNSIFWSDNNNALVLGQESKAAYYSNIVVENCDILFTRNEKPHCAALSIICVHSTDYSNIRFEDIRVQGWGQLIRIYYPDLIFGRMQGDHQWPGEINGVIFRNISAKGLGLSTVRIDGYSREKQVRNVTLDNVTVNGRKVSRSSPEVVLNRFTKRIQFR